MTCPVGLLRGSAVPETGLLSVPLTGWGGGGGATDLEFPWDWVTRSCFGGGATCGAQWQGRGQGIGNPGAQAELCLRGRGAIVAVPERLQSGHEGCESGWGWAVTGGWTCGWGGCWGMGMPLGQSQGGGGGGGTRCVTFRLGTPRSSDSLGLRHRRRTHAHTPVRLTRAVANASLPSVIVYVNVSLPVYPVSGVYVNVPSTFSDATPLEGCLNDATDSLSPSGSLSLANTVTTTGVLTLVMSRSSTACGGPFTETEDNGRSVRDHGRTGAGGGEGRQPMGRTTPSPRNWFPVPNTDPTHKKCTWPSSVAATATSRSVIWSPPCPRLTHWKGAQGWGKQGCIRGGEGGGSEGGRGGGAGMC